MPKNCSPKGDAGRFIDPGRHLVLGPLSSPRGRWVVRERVQQALRKGDACWCAMVRPELWNGVGGDREKKVPREFEWLLPDLPVNARVWEISLDLAQRARVAWVFVPATNVLVAACAHRHQVVVEYADSDLNLLAGIEWLN